MSASPDAFSHWSRSLAHPAGRALLAGFSDDAIACVASSLASDSGNAENSIIELALAAVGGASGARTEDAYAHKLTAIAREARWQCEQGEAIHFQVEGREWLSEVKEHGVLIVMPMQVCTSDAIAAVSKCFPGREVVFFGEGVSAATYPWIDPPPVFASQGMDGVRQILRVLSTGGVFCTYPDFVYQGRGALHYLLFGRNRSMASAMLSMAMRTRAVLLPAQARLSMESMEIKIEEPLEIGTQITGEAGLRQLVGVVGGILEAQIAQNPGSWLLLNSLVAASPQMAVAGRSSQAAARY
ncbi:hypothetical protein [Luteimonas sp. 100069]|uniref:LpxL/LpxP family acyltransferase n=1 Tax=Luteimonas sp. 100069 TaxID=2006109 RepID=UPI00131557D1|nr:hypothetical protein [Luteimonas sp. 100069]